jgi:hypothetical protein
MTFRCHLEAMAVTALDSPLDQLPAPPTIHERMGRLYRELALLRRLLRLSQAAHANQANTPDTDRTPRKGVSRG